MEYSPDYNFWNEYDADYNPSFDPASLLPFACTMEPDDPAVVKIPSAYRGSMEKGFLDVINRSGMM